MLIHMVIKSNNNFPRDAISLARAELYHLAKRITRISNIQSLDSIQKLIWLKTLSKIKAALSEITSKKEFEIKEYNGKKRYAQK